MLIKTGQLAKRAGVLPSKIRFYVKEGLIQPSDLTAGGYCLFDEKCALDRLREIAHLQTADRLTIEEIKGRLRDTMHCLASEEDHG